MKRAARGFTLLEVLVAFALLAVALTLLLGALSSAASQVGTAAQRARAVLHAQSLLASAGVVEPLAVGRREGEWEQGAYRWTLQVSPYVEPRPEAGAAAAAPPLAGPQLVQLELQVQWQGARAGRLQWRTLRLLPPALEQGT